MTNRRNTPAKNPAESVRRVDFTPGTNQQYARLFRQLVDKGIAVQNEYAAGHEFVLDETILVVPFAGKLAAMKRVFTDKGPTRWIKLTDVSAWRPFGTHRIFGSVTPLDMELKYVVESDRDEPDAMAVVFEIPAEFVRGNPGDDPELAALHVALLRMLADENCEQLRQITNFRESGVRESSAREAELEKKVAELEAQAEELQTQAEKLHVKFSTAELNGKSASKQLDAATAAKLIAETEIRRLQAELNKRDELTEQASAVDITELLVATEEVDASWPETTPLPDPAIPQSSSEIHVSKGRRFASGEEVQTRGFEEGSESQRNTFIGIQPAPARRVMPEAEVQRALEAPDLDEAPVITVSESKSLSFADRVSAMAKRFGGPKKPTK